MHAESHSGVYWADMTPSFAMCIMACIKGNNTLEALFSDSSALALRAGLVFELLLLLSSRQICYLVMTGHEHKNYRLQLFCFEPCRCVRNRAYVQITLEVPDTCCCFWKGTKYDWLQQTHFTLAQLEPLNMPCFRVTALRSRAMGAMLIPSSVAS